MAHKIGRPGLDLRSERHERAEVCPELSSGARQIKTLQAAFYRPYSNKVKLMRTRFSLGQKLLAL